MTRASTFTEIRFRGCAVTDVERTRRSKHHTGERLCRRVARKAGLGLPQNPQAPFEVLPSELEFSAQNSNLEVVRFARRFNQVVQVPLAHGQHP
jgi:hypothetical protein